MTEQTIQLADGNTMPLVGFGTYLINTQELMDQSIKTAFDAGYRLFDTAQFYRNEDFLGQTLINLQIPRDQVFITSKVAELSQGYDHTIESVDDSLQRLKTNYLDLLLIHWPMHEYFFDTWRALNNSKRTVKLNQLGCLTLAWPTLNYSGRTLRKCQWSTKLNVIHT